MGLGSGKNEAIKDYNHLVKCVSSNTGNLVFNFAVEHLIHFTQSDIRWSTPAAEINKEKTPLLIPMANNIGPHTDVNHSGPKLTGVEVHKTIMGLGAQFPVTLNDPKEAASQVPEGTSVWLNSVVNNTKVANISVRGKFTQDVLTELGYGEFVVALGCPSHFINNNPNLGSVLAQRCSELDMHLASGIAVTAGNPGIKNLNKLERFLIGLIDEFNGRYIVQHPESLIRLSQRWEDAISEADIEHINQSYFPAKSTYEMLCWFSKNSTTYVSVPQWMLDISKHALCVGTRIHGVQVAIQSGIPALCLYMDSRTKELCDTMHIPAISAHAFQKDPTLQEIINTLKSWDWESYDKNRRRLAESTEVFLKSNELSLRRNKVL